MMEMQEKIRRQLESLAEDEYRIFSSKLLPKTGSVLGCAFPCFGRCQNSLRGRIGERICKRRETVPLKKSCFREWSSAA
jgi:hypothetical protein